MNMLKLFKPGDVLYGYCQGYFGRDDYWTKTCVSVRPKYAVFEYNDTGYATTLNYSESLERADIEEWKKPEEDE